MYVQFILLCGAINVAHVLGAPTKGISLNEQLLKISQEKCPYVQKLKVIDTESEFLKNCNYGEPLNRGPLDENIQNYVLCLMYYSVFDNLCDTLNRSTPIPQELLVPENIIKEFIKNTSVEMACGSLGRIDGTILSKTPYLTDLKNSTTCLRLCTNYSKTRDICILSSFIWNYTSMIQKKKIPPPASSVNDPQESSSVSDNLIRVEDDKKPNSNTNSKEPNSNTNSKEPNSNTNSKEPNSNTNSKALPPVNNTVQPLPKDQVDSTIVNKIVKDAINSDSVIKTQQTVDEKVHNSDSKNTVNEKKAVEKLPPTPKPVTTVGAVPLEPIQKVEHISPQKDAQPPKNNANNEQVENANNNNFEDPEDTQSVYNGEDDEFANEVVEKPDKVEPKQSDAGVHPMEPVDTDKELPPKSSEVKSKIVEVPKPKEINEENLITSVNYQNQNIDDSDSYFFSYFMMICVIFVCGYVAYHNKQKILALVLEGRKGKRHTRGKRPNSANYRKLDTTLEEAVTSSCNKNTTQVIY